MKTMYAIVLCFILLISLASTQNLSDETVVLSTVKNVFGDSVTGIIIETLPDGTLVMTNLNGQRLRYQKEIIQTVEHKTVSLVSVLKEPIFTNKTHLTLVDGSSLEGYVLHASPDKHYSVLLADGSVTTIEAGTVNTIENKTTPLSMDDYNRLKKSPFVAYFLSAIPGVALGHAYAENWGRGMTFELIEIGIVGVGGIIGYSLGKDVGLEGWGAAAVILSPYVIIPLLIIDMIQAFDAAACASEYNEKLKVRLQQPEPTTSLLLRYTDDTPELGITLRF